MEASDEMRNVAMLSDGMLSVEMFKLKCIFKVECLDSNSSLSPSSNPNDQIQLLKFKHSNPIIYPYVDR